MNPFAFAKRRPVVTLILFGLLAGGAFAGLEMAMSTAGSQNTSKLNVYLHTIGTHFEQAKQYIAARFESHPHARNEQSHEEADNEKQEPAKQQAHHEGSDTEETHGETQKIVATSPEVKDVVLNQPYVCQIHAQRHIEVCAISGGYLQEILVKEGQAVKKGDPMFKILPILYQAKFNAESAEAHLAEMKYKNTQALVEKKVVSPNEAALFRAEYEKAQAKASLAGAELNFTSITAPFDGIVDRLQQREGSLIDEGDTLTTLSDNSVMWVYFNVPEAQYLDYMAHEDLLKADEIELVLANGKKFTNTGKIGAIEAKFNNETGNIPFRADFSNPKRMLRHGQTGTVLLHQTLTDAVVIPQRATFELLDKRYVYVIDEDGVAHQRLISVNKKELDDVFIVEKGLKPGEKIVLEGVREVHDGQKTKYEFLDANLALAHQKHHAE